MSFKSKIRHFSEIERALLFALKVYSKNSPIEGVILNVNYKPPVISDVLEISEKMTDRLLKKALDEKVLGKIGERYLIRDYWLNSDIDFKVSKLKEISRSPNVINSLLSLLGLKKSRIKIIVDDICYSIKEVESVKDIFEKNSNCELLGLIKEYAYSFSTKKGKNKKTYTRSIRLKDNLRSLFQIIENEKFIYNQGTYNTNIDLIEEALRIAISKDMIELQNNNYVKKILIQKGRKQEQNDY